MANISSLNDIKKGVCIDMSGQPYIVLEANFVRMQQRKPVMQTKMKNLINGKVLEYSFKPGENIKEADLQRSKASFLYTDRQAAFFMNNESFEQVEMPIDQLGDKIKYLKEGVLCDVLYFQGMPVNINIPPKIDLIIVETPEGVKGDSAQGRVTKVAKTETGYDINVPLFINKGNVVKINTETGEYVERVDNSKQG